ncbi:LOW QUALITY PROTEIN: eukaryotic translation initiation factor 3 subunit D-like [Pomacea canaliculata]|uniref:LOW QUALITY PROTEIN: eukaryotic translation initiation factor 3 subunit D-like n=1 Tax=Pomacea canaliculata TaxID=400727 RepID=UPI000D72E0A9|nr:LOW QUALITY PROTEIN: eukaryotic translation initiation factor 3 subunit D-like [Pomacea canaliculata]
MMARFAPPQIQDNPQGWGPCEMPEMYKDLPYQPFAKDVRLGKVSDWTGATYQDKRYLGKYNSAFAGQQYYAYYHEEDESSFQLVDTARVQRPIYQRGRRLFQQSKQRRERERRQQQAQANMQVLTKTQKNRERDRQRMLKKWQKQFGKQMQENRNKAPMKHRDASVQIKDDWPVVEEMDFPRLTKLNLPDIKEGEDLMRCGAMETYDKSYDRITTKNEKRLKRINRIFHKVTTTDDPIIRELAKSQGNVFATDAILATIMCCTRSSYSWDIVVHRVGSKLFFDKRDDSDFDLLTVSETASEPPQDEGASINSPRNLALEATFINHNFSQQVLRVGDDKYQFENKNPFVQPEEESEVASVGYRYRKWDLGNDIVLISRCEHDAVMYGPNNEVQFISVKSLNEWDSRFCGGVDWRSRLDSQRGAVLATELKNNSCKLAKWTVAAILAGSDQIKFGYVSRVHVKDTSKHVILGTQQFKPTEFAAQINLNMDNAWGILRCIVDTCMKLKEGKYLIMKDPNKPVIRIYDIPDHTFESDDEDESSSDDSEEESESEDEADK